METQNAIIESVGINTNDGFLTATVLFDYGDGGHQGMGSWVLYAPKSWAHHKIESVAGHFIYRIMEVAGVSEWEKLVGKSVRVKHDWDKVESVGHITKNDWFSPREDFRDCK